MKLETGEQGRGGQGSVMFEHRITVSDAENVHGIIVETSAPYEQQSLLVGHIDDGEQVPQPDTLCGNSMICGFVCTRFIVTLPRFLSTGYRWIINMTALFLYGLFVLPGLLQVCWRYFFDKRIRRGIPYGKNPRNKLDLYIPDKLETPRPVVVFVPGGAWIIGYKAWGCLLGLQLVEEDVIVACMDYRNFPQATVSDMVEDVLQSLSFICNNIGNYGGDLNRLYLVGQSAGAHLGACALLNQAKKECERINGQTNLEENEGGLTSPEELESGEVLLSWRASQFKSYIGISGGYDLSKLAEHVHSRGMNRTLFLRIMEGENSLALYSPELCLQNLENVGRFLPPFHLFHGTDDRSIPYNSSVSFVEALRSSGAQATAKLYEGKSHTDLFIQDPLRGGRNALLEDILAVLNISESKDSLTRMQKRLVPEFLLKLARKVSPF